MNKSGDILNVKELNEIIKNTLLETFTEQIKVKGEISNAKQSGNNIYFTLKDASSSINCVIWNKKIFDLKMKDGLCCVINGNLSCYTNKGTYQITVNKLEISGIGNLHEEYERLKCEFEKKGYFDVSNKKPFPKSINTIGILTALDGAALQDVLVVLKTNNFSGKVYIKNCNVQGSSCSKSIKEGISYFNELNNTEKIDILLITRGGGSFEDLMEYSSKMTVKSIYECNIFTISAIGHEVDNMLSDLAADYRAPTPTFAGEIISSIQKKNKDKLNDLINNFKLCKTKIDNKIDNYLDKLKMFTNSLQMINPNNYLLNEQNKLINIKTKFEGKLNDNINAYVIKINELKQSNEKFNTKNNLNNGYTLIIDENNNIVYDSATFNKLKKNKQKLKILFADGECYI